MEKQLELQPRLQALANWLPPGCRLADIGTDHGYLPIYALQTGRAVFAIAADLRPEPLDHARRSAMMYEVGEQLIFRLCDGLCGILPEEADVLVLAGMGGETIAAILEAAPWAADGLHTLLLQPMSRADTLRLWLAGHGYRALRERLVEDKGLLYPILEVTGGAMAMPTAGALQGGLLLADDPLAGTYIKQQSNKLRHAIDGLARSRREADHVRRTALEQALLELNTMGEEWSHAHSQGN